MSKAIAVDLDQLVMGRPLVCPIHDLQGTLLLASGSELTPKLKQKLISRGVHQALVPEDQVALLSLSGVDKKALKRLTEKLNDFIDEAVRAGRFELRNTGPAVSERVVEHGCKEYDSKHQTLVKTQQAKNATQVRGLLKALLSDSETDASSLDGTAQDTVELLTQDIGGTLNVGLLEEGTTLSHHSVKMSTLAMAIAIEMGLDDSNVRLTGVCALLADVGMSKLPVDICDAARRLTRNEFAKVQMHAIYTANCLEKMRGIPDIARVIAYQVHERPDGTGYPRGRRRVTIHPLALLLHIADAYVAMTSSRPFRQPMMPYAAMRELILLANRGKIDRACVRALLHVVSLFPLGSLVVLSDGSVAQVLRANGEQYATPVVARIQNADGETVDPDAAPELINLAESDLSIIQALSNPTRHETNVVSQPASIHWLSTASDGPPGLGARFV